MAFDPSSARLDNTTAFDPTSAQLEPNTAFDPNSAQPEETPLLSMRGLKGLVSTIPTVLQRTGDEARFGAWSELLDSRRAALEKLVPGTAEYIAQEKQVVEAETSTHRLRENIQNLDRQIESVAPHPSEPLRAAMGVVPSIATMAPSMITRSPAPLAYQATEGELAASAYGQAREEGATPEKARGYSTISGGMEALTEWIPMGKLFKELGTEGTKRLLVKTLGREIASEEINTAVDQFAHQALVTPDKPFDQFLDEWGSAARITAYQAGMQTAVLSPVIAAANRAESPEAREMAARQVLQRELEREVTGELRKPLPTRTAVEESTTTKKAGAAYTTAEQEFMRENIPPQVWSEFVEQYSQKLGVPVAKGIDADKIVDWVAERITEAPDVGHQVVMANIDQITRAGMTVPEIVGRAVDRGAISEDAGRGVIERAASTMSIFVDDLHRQLVTTKAQFIEKQEAFAGEKLRDDIFVNTKVAEITAALENTIAQIKEGQFSDLASVKAVIQKSGLPRAIKDTAMAATYSDSAPNGTPHVLQDALRYFRGLTPTAGRASVARVSPQYSNADNLLRTHTLTPDILQATAFRFGAQQGPLPSFDTLRNTAKAGEVSVVQLPGAYVNTPTVKRIRAVVRKWTTKYTKNISIIVVSYPPDYANYFGEMAYVGKNASGVDVYVLRIQVNPNHMSRTILTLSHEFGHVMFTQYYRNATPRMQEVLRQQWLEWLLVRHFDTPIRNIMEQQRPDASYSPKNTTTVGDIMLRQFSSGTVDAAPNITGQEHNVLDYFLNFPEWQAYMTERMLVADYDSIAQPVRTYFKQVAAQIKYFFVGEHQLWAPDQTVAEWLRLMQEYDAATAEGRTALDTARAQQITSGLVGNIPQISSDNLGNLPPIPPLPAIRDDFSASILQLAKVLKRASPDHGPNVVKSVVKYNELMGATLGAFQLLKLNANVPGAMRFLDALRAKMGYKSKIQREATSIAADWEKLGKEQAGAVAKLLMVEAETGEWLSDQMPDPKQPGHYMFVLPEAVMLEYKINERGAEVYSQVRDSFVRALEAMEAVGAERIARQFADDPSNPQMQQQLDALHNSYAAMRSKPYTPFSRFGKYYIKVKARDNGRFKDPITGTSKFYTEGQTLYFETFETETERNLATAEIKRRYSDAVMADPQFNTGKIHDIVYSVRNLPPQFLRSVADRLGLTDAQLVEYNDIIKDLAADTSFVKHLKRKANISGASPDALRSYADYFLRFSNSYAKAKSAPEIEAALTDTRLYKRELEATEQDTTELDRLYNWMQRTRDYVMNPGNELGELKSFVAAWYLGFNIPSAVQNLTQLPFWTIPYLSKRFGTGKTMVTVTKALNDTLQSWTNPRRFSADEKALISYALDMGFINESYATSIAQFAEGSVLHRLTATAFRHRALNSYNHKAMYMFQLMEEINRRTTLLATYRLNRKPQYSGDFDMAAFNVARDAVEVTQNEYALENRPPIMRGNKSVMFQFMHYMQNAIFQMSPMGDASWKRLLLMQLMVGGLLGLPFAEDLLNLAKFLARKFDIPFEPELALRQLLVELDIEPDWVLRGSTAHLGPFDVSYRYSLGQVIPGMHALGSNQRFSDAMLTATGDIGGAGASIAINAMKAVAVIGTREESRAIEYAAPTFARYIIQATRAYEAGGIVGRNNALLAPLSTGEILGMGIGLQPRAKMQTFQQIGFESEVRNYWMTRRAAVLHNFDAARTANDREAIADVWAEVRAYNKDAAKVDRALQITPKTIKRSQAARASARQKQQQEGTPYSTQELRQSIEEATP